MRLSLVSILPLCLTVLLVTAQDVGDSCNITGTLALDPTFVGSARVAAPPHGCTIGSETDCYCGPILGDAGNQDAQEWSWQCGDNVVFGPIQGKTCPASLPAEQEACNATLHPTGFGGDPGCGYSNCDGAATFSSVCGCIPLSFIGGQGRQRGNDDDVGWVCLKSTCDCPEDAMTTSAGAGFVAEEFVALSVGLLLILVVLGN